MGVWGVIGRGRGIIMDGRGCVCEIGLVDLAYVLCAWACLALC